MRLDAPLNGRAPTLGAPPDCGPHLVLLHDRLTGRIQLEVCGVDDHVNIGQLPISRSSLVVKAVYAGPRRPSTRR